MSFMEDGEDKKQLQFRLTRGGKGYLNGNYDFEKSPDHKYRRK